MSEENTQEESQFFLSEESVTSMRNKVELRTEIIECPELNEAVGVEEEGKNVAFEVQQCDLSSYLALQAKKDRGLGTFAAGLVKALKKQNEEEIAEYFSKFLTGGEGMSPQAEFEIDLCQKFVLRPKMKRSDWIWLSEAFPFTVNKIANRIMSLTVQGGIKKN
jgi:hypothetical protein